MKRFTRSLAQAHQELQILVRRGIPGILRTKVKVSDLLTSQRLEQEVAPLSKEAWRKHHFIFLIKFWRICCQLLQRDLVSRGEFSFVIDFTLALEKITYQEYGSAHPLTQLLVALCQVPKGSLQETLEFGVSYTIRVLAPKIRSSRHVIQIYQRWIGYS